MNNNYNILLPEEEELLKKLEKCTSIVIEMQKKEKTDQLTNLVAPFKKKKFERKPVKK